MSIYTPSDIEEKELMEEIERGEWIPVSPKKRIELLDLSKKAAIESKKKGVE